MGADDNISIDKCSTTFLGWNYEIYIYSFLWYLLQGRAIYGYPFRTTLTASSYCVS